MKKFTYLQLFLGIIILSGMYSCTPKYTASFSPSNSFYHTENKIAQEEPKEQKTTVVEEKEEVALVSAPVIKPEDEVLKNIISEEVKTPEGIVSREKAIEAARAKSKIPELVKAHEDRVEAITNSDLSEKEISKAIKKEEKEAKKEIRKEFKKEVKELKKTNSDDEYALMMILCIIPFLGVGLTYGITAEFWISLLLTILFYIPGLVYALIVVHQYYR